MKLAINGFGRIGRKVMRLALERSDLEIVGINDLCDVKTVSHLFRYDSIYGPLNADVRTEGKSLIANGKTIKLLSERNPSELPWGDLGVDIVLECTGIFSTREQAGAHLKGGAKKVLISAPSKDADLTVCMGINDEKYDPATHHVLSNASCTTNALAPVAKVLSESFGFQRGLMTTIHSYTNDQRLLDLPHKDLRRSRAAALNMIPTSTGAAKAIGLVLPQLVGKLDGFAMRVPTPNVSVVDLTAELEKSATVEDINKAMLAASEGRLKGILRYTDEPLVSGDFNGDTHSSAFDSLCTQVIDGKMVKVLTWYDNESGYSARLLDLAILVGKSL